MHPLEKLVVAIQAFLFVVGCIGLGWLLWSQIPWWFSGPEEELFLGRLALILLTFVALPISIFGPPIRRRLRARRREAGSG